MQVSSWCSGGDDGGRCDSRTVVIAVGHSDVCGGESSDSSGGLEKIEMLLIQVILMLFCLHDGGRAGGNVLDGVGDTCLS